MNPKDLLPFTIISNVFSTIPFFIGIKNLRFVKKEYLPYFILVIIAAIAEIVNFITAHIGKNNLFILNFYTFFEFILISLFYILYFKKFFRPYFFVATLPIFLVVAFYDYKTNGLNHMDNLAMSMECIVFISFALFFFFHVMKNLITERLSDYAPFWFNSAVLVYFLGNSLLFIFSNYLYATETEKYAVMWTIVHSFFNIIYNILLSIGFWKIKRT